MMDSDNIIIDENTYYDLKEEIDEFLIKMNEETLKDFKSQFSVLFDSVQTAFNNACNNQKSLNELKDKLKRSVKNLSETRNGIKEEMEKVNNMRNESENLTNKLENVKSEETEKEKEIRTLNEEISKLSKILEEDPSEEGHVNENEIKKKMADEEDNIAKKIELLDDKKKQIFQKYNDTFKNKKKADEENKESEEKYNSLKEELKGLEKQLSKEKKTKEEMDTKLAKLKDSNEKLRDQIEKIKKDKIQLLLTIENVITKNENELNSQKYEYEYQIKDNERKLPDLKKKNMEIEKKNKEYEETLKHLKDSIKQKDEMIEKYDKDIKVHGKSYNIYKEKIITIKAEYDKIVEQKDSLEEEILLIDEDIKNKRNKFDEYSEDLKKKKLEKIKLDKDLTTLMERIKEIDFNINKLKNDNHHLINEHYGIKRESEALEYERENIEKDKNLYAKHASDANMEHTQALEKLKNLSEAINELKAKNQAAESKLKQQKKIYEALKADCARFAKKYQETQVENKELTDEKEKKDHKYGNLKIEFAYKQGLKESTSKSLEERAAKLKADESLKNNLEIDIKNIKESVIKLRENNNNLKKMIAKAENDHQTQKKEYQIVVNERDFLDQQLIKRNEEVVILYEKIKTLQLELSKLHSQYKKKLIEIEKLKTTRNFLIEEFVKAESIIRNIFDLKVIKIKLEKELLITKNKVSSLTIESRKHMNIHRWTKLEYSDPEKFELISQINSLQKRLIAKSEEVQKKEELIQEKEQLYIKLKSIVSRQNGPDMEDTLVKYQKKIKEETDRLKRTKEEIKFHRNNIRSFEFEIKRIDSCLTTLKNEWFELMKKKMTEIDNSMREYEEESNEEEQHPLHDLINNNAEYLEYYNKLNSA